MRFLIRLITYHWVFTVGLVLTLLSLYVGFCNGVFAMETAPSKVAGQDVSLQIKQAQALFKQYQALEDTYDATLQNLYANTADIRMLKIHPDGQQEGLHIPINQYKQRLDQLMPLAKANSDKGLYYGIEYVPMTQFVQIKSKRKALPSNETGFVHLVVGPSDPKHPENRWQIYEEYFERYLSQ